MGEAEHDQVYAIIRLDTFHNETGSVHTGVTVKEIVRTLEEAQTEVSRLNKLNGDKGCFYFWQSSHLHPEGTRSQVSND